MTLIMIGDSALFRGIMIQTWVEGFKSNFLGSEEFKSKPSNIFFTSS